MRESMSQRFVFSMLLCLPLSLLLAGCSAKGKADIDAEAPPPPKVEQEQDVTIVKADHPEQFPLATVGQNKSAPELRVTGAVSPDVSRNIPVISMASGRVVEISARLGDAVAKGQLLMRIQSADIGQAFSDYRQAVADEKLARSQLERSRALYEKGAIAQKDLEVSEDTEAKANVTVETTTQRLRLLGVTDLEHPEALVNITAPSSGVIIEQNGTNAAGVKTLDNSPNLFTIADLSQVWIICDVYENDLPFIRVGEFADIRLNAYPDMLLKGRIETIGPVLDPSIRTAKVRLELHNPGMLRFGMFVTAVFHGQNQETHAAVPASAVLHLHDRDWVYVAVDYGKFHRVAVTGGKMLPNNMQEIVSGIAPGEQVATNALVLQNTAEQ